MSTAPYPISKSKRASSRRPSAAWVLFLSTLVLLSVSPKHANADESCPNCGIADTILKPCNSSLQMQTWPGTLVYQPTLEQSACACNQNYYDQMVGCLRCQSSSSAHYSVKDIDSYKLVCLSMNQQWKLINLPNQTTTTITPTITTPSTSMGASVPTTIDAPSGNKTVGGIGSGNSSLSSGAIAGIVVSVIALVVALSVAAYVWGRRRRDRARNAGGLDEYKYRDTQPDSYMEVALPQYTGMIQPTLPPISKVSNLRVMNPDSDDDENGSHSALRNHSQHQPSFEVRRTSSPGWRRGSFDDD